jgi:hypothetical protein
MFSSNDFCHNLKHLRIFEMKFFAFIISMLFSLRIISCDENFELFCKENYFDVIFFDGFKYLFARKINESYYHDWEALYNENTDSLNDFTHYIQSK